jgi:hypothetical protein
MQIVVKKKVLEEMIDQVVREVSSFHSVRIDEIPAKLDDEDVVKPTEEMATQLSTQKPNVDDDAYKPVNTSELTKAASAVAEKVPQDKVQKFYKQLKDLAQQTVDGKETDDSMLSERKMSSILAFLLDRPVHLHEARKGDIDPRSPEGITIDAQIKASDASVDRFTGNIERQDRRQSGSVSLSRIPSLTMSVVYSLLAAIAKKSGEQFKRPQDLADIKAELLQPGAITLSDDKRKMKLRARGTTAEVGGFGTALHNVSKEQMIAAAEKAINDHFDELVEFITTGHLMGDPSSGIKREREGTLRTEAGDLAKEILIQLGEQLPISASVPDDTLRSFGTELGEFIKNTLSPENNQFSYTFADLVIKVKKGKKGQEAAEEEEEDADEVSTVKQVIIDLSKVADDIQQLPAEAGAYSRGDMTAIGQMQIGRVNTAEFFKNKLAQSIMTNIEDLLEKFVKVKHDKFAAGIEGRNLASDILRRMGGSRADIPAEKVNLLMRDISQTGEEEGQTPEEIEQRQFDALFATDILNRERFDMRVGLYQAFIEEFMGPVIFLASKAFEDSARVSREFQNAVLKPLDQIADKDPIFSMYTDVLKMFGSSRKTQVSRFFRTYEKILQDPGFKSFVENQTGATGVSDLSRASTAFFDKDITLVFIVNMAAAYAKTKLREPTMVRALVGKTQGNEFNIVKSFKNYLEQDIINGIKDGDPEPLKLLKKVEDMIEDSGMGFVKKQPEKKKKGEPVSEAAILRSIIRRAIR